MTDKRIASLMTDRQLQEVLGSVDTLYGACSDEIDRRGKDLSTSINRILKAQRDQASARTLQRKHGKGGDK
jgi:hypothetical protein